MRSLKSLAVKSAICLLAICIIDVQSQWVWNKNLNGDRDRDRGSSGNRGNSQYDYNNNGGRDVQNDRFFVGQTNNNPASSNKYAASGQSRLFPNAISAISNSIGNIASGGGGLGNLAGGGGGILGVLGSVPQLIAGLFSPGSGAGTLPEKLPIEINPGGSGGGGSSGGSSSDKACNCFHECVLPFVQDSGSGNCGGGMRMCCRSGGGGGGLRFEEERPSRPNTRQIRAGLFQKILQGGNQVVDDTLDLFLQPFLTDADQQRIVDRIADN